MRRAANHVAELKVRQASAPAYVYVVEWEIDPVLRSPHTTDVPLAFDTLSTVPVMAAAPGSQRVAEQMSSAWIAFALTGDPNTGKTPRWPAYSTASRPNMLFNIESHVALDYGKEARLFWDAS
jgi:para-nitrobenzyl esterase